MEGKERRVLLTTVSSGSRPRTIPRNNMKNLPRSPFSELRYHRARTCNVRAFTRDRIYLYTSLRRPEGFTIGPVVLSSRPPSLLIYSARRRCSQITVFFMTAVATPVNTFFPTINPRGMRNHRMAASLSALPLRCLFRVFSCVSEEVSFFLTDLVRNRPVV